MSSIPPVETAVGLDGLPHQGFDLSRPGDIGFNEGGLAAFPSMNSKDLADDPHLKQRGFFAELPHTEVGLRKHTGIPWLLSESPNGVQAHAPLLGQHTDQIMRDVLGYSDEHIAQLKERQVLY